MVMQFKTLDIALALNLIIPFHGIFISFFFFNKSVCSLSPNFFLGSLLFVLSSLILFQLMYFGYNVFTDLNISLYYLCELLTCPFLFLYNSIIIRPCELPRIYSHLAIIALVFLLFTLIAFANGSVYIMLTVIFIIINGLYMAGSVYLLIYLIRGADLRSKYFQTSVYSGIIIFNLLMVGAFLISAILQIIHPVSIIYFAQIPKDLVIYYIYYQILKRA